MNPVAEVSNAKATRREHSSAGRAHALQAWGHRFEPCCSHHLIWPGGAVGQHASLSRWRSTVRVRSGSPILSSSHLRIFAPDASVAQQVEQRTENPRVVGSIPTGGTRDAGVAHPVERHLAKVEVASSSLVTRSNFIWYRGQVVRQRSAKPLFPSSNLGGTSSSPVCSQVCTGLFLSFLYKTLAKIHKTLTNSSSLLFP